MSALVSRMIIPWAATHFIRVQAHNFGQGGQQFPPFAVRPEQTGMLLAVVQNDMVQDVQLMRVRVLARQHRLTWCKLTSCASTMIRPTMRS